ncbi:MAG: hypothetical protein P9L98_01645 [Candidatus Kaelpia imicola]|nr:hypothetical protein [Candidatus Kaelpia imicola]
MKPHELQNLKKTLTEASKFISVKPEKPDSKQRHIIDEWKKLKFANYVDIPEFNIPKNLIKVTLNTKEYNALIFYGEGGLGKTVLAINRVREILEPDDYEYYNGYSTPLSIYEILYRARNKKLLILDDIEGIFGNPVATSILKGALWESGGKRLIQYNTKSEKAEGLPDIFEFKAKLIILCNKIPNQQDIGVSAMISRTVSYEFKLSFEQKIEIIGKLIDSRKDLSMKQKQECLKLIKEETSEATRNFNFRLLKKAIAFVKEDKANAKELFKATVEKDEDKEIVLKLMKSDLSVSEQAVHFWQRTGKSRRTFFRIKKEVSK